MRSTPNQYIILAALVALGALWVFLAQNWIFLNLFPGMFAVGGGLDLEGYLQTGSSPSFTALWFSCIVAVLVWLIATSSARPRNSSEARNMRPFWWLVAAVLIMLGWIYQLFFTVFIWQIRGESPVEGSGINYFPLPPGGWAILFVFVVLDVMILFWLPTLFASPRNYRLVVPGAVKLLGGR